MLKLAGPLSNTPPIVCMLSQLKLTVRTAWASFLGSAVLTIAISVDLWARVTDLRLIPVLADMTPSTKAAHAMIAVRESYLPTLTQECALNGSRTRCCCSRVHVADVLRVAHLPAVSQVVAARPHVLGE